MIIPPAPNEGSSLDFVSARSDARRATALLASIPSQGLAGGCVPPDETFSVMTLNLFTGADFKPLLAAKPSGDFLAAVTAGYKSTLASRPAERMGAIACDKVEMVPARGLLDGLAGLKQHYAAVAILPGLDCGSSDYAGFNGRFTMQDVILARMDRRRFKFSPSNLQAQRFLAQQAAISASSRPISRSAPVRFRLSRSRRPTNSSPPPGLADLWSRLKPADARVRPAAENRI